MPKDAVLDGAIAAVEGIYYRLPVQRHRPGLAEPGITRDAKLLVRVDGPYLHCAARLPDHVGPVVGDSGLQQSGLRVTIQDVQIARVRRQSGPYPPLLRG